MDVTYLGQASAVAVDEELMGPLGFSVDQLMELAGLSVACSLAAEYPAASHGRVLVLAGPGNNGGDGLVAARHLHHFGYTVTVCYPKPTDKPLYNGLVTQCRSLGLQFVDVNTLRQQPLRDNYDVVIDALFGFSFKGSPRPPFDAVLQLLAPAAQPPAVVSVDVPSGWDVELGDTTGSGLRPDMLVSLTAPKLAAKNFQGAHHYLGGRFVPPAIREKYDLVLPDYPGTSQCVKLPTPQASDSAASLGHAVADLRISYERGGLLEGDVSADPLKQFDVWFKDAVAAAVTEEPNAMTLATAGSDGQPHARMVLLKGYDDRGFVFYTNYESDKGEQLQTNPRAALVFYWGALQRSVRVEGAVARVDESESAEYFHSRPRGSQIGAWVSTQSKPVAGGRQEIEDRNTMFQQKFSDDSIEVPKPPHWGGFLLRPVSIEFWQGRPSRLHDRLRYKRHVPEGAWTLERLYP